MTSPEGKNKQKGQLRRTKKVDPVDEDDVVQEKAKQGKYRRMLHTIVSPRRDKEPSIVDGDFEGMAKKSSKLQRMLGVNGNVDSVLPGGPLKEIDLFRLPLGQLELDACEHWRSCPLSTTFEVTIQSAGREDLLSFANAFAGRSMSTYPFNAAAERRDGDPIADNFGLRLYENRIVAAVADGCGWGVPSSLAARTAVRSFNSFLKARRHALGNVRRTAELVLEAFYQAHKDVCKTKTDTDETGTTTLAGGVLLQMTEPHALKEERTAGLKFSSAESLVALDGRLKLAAEAASKRRGIVDTRERRQSVDSLRSFSDERELETGARLRAPRQGSIDLYDKSARLSARQRRTRASVDVTADRSERSEFSMRSSPLICDELLRVQQQEASGGEHDSGDDGFDDADSDLDPDRSPRYSNMSRRMSDMALLASTSSEKPPLVVANSHRVNPALTRPDKYAFVFACVGDVKVFRCQQLEGGKCRVVDVTRGDQRAKSADADNKFRSEDCGGRIGPMVDQVSWLPETDGTRADLRNLSVRVVVCERGDVLMMMSDGVADNLDPEVLGEMPTRGGLWRDVPDAERDLEKTEWRAAYLAEAMSRCQFNLAEFVRVVVQFCADTTRPSRRFMEGFPTKQLPRDYTQFKGKLDHTTLIAVRVGPILFR